MQEPQDSWVNVIKLRKHQHDYCLRIDRYRVLFDYDNEVKIIQIERVKNEMETHIKIQVIEQNSKPAFAVIDWRNYQDLLMHVGDKPNDYEKLYAT